MPILEPIVDEVQSAIDAGTVSGALTLVTQRGEVIHSDVRGVDPESGDQMGIDTVLWQASMTKPVIATGILALVEEGRLHLNDRISQYVPEFAKPGVVRVLKPGSSLPPSTPFAPPPDPPPEFDLVAAERELTIHDLLTHTGGLQSIAIWNPDFVFPEDDDTLETYVPTLANLPRDFQAGAQWAYSNAASFDVLTRVIEVASESAIDAFLKTRVFDPLGARTFSFGAGLKDPKAQKLPEMFAANPAVLGKTYFSGAAGLWACPSDYVRFVQMMLNGGELNGSRILKRESVSLLSTNLVGHLFEGLNGRTPARGFGFGYGVAVVVRRGAGGTNLPEGSFGWDGVGTRRFWAIPSGDVVLYIHSADQGLQESVERVTVEALKL